MGTGSHKNRSCVSLPLQWVLFANVFSSDYHSRCEEMRHITLFGYRADNTLAVAYHKYPGQKKNDRYEYKRGVSRKTLRPCDFVRVSVLWSEQSKN